MDQAILHDATVQHPDDQSQHSLVPYSVLQKLHHPCSVDRIKKRSDVGLHHMGDSFLLDYPAECIQALMGTAFRSVSIAAVFEYGFVDGFQRPFRRFLNNLVFEIADS
jgi:hypothetical protein